MKNDRANTGRAVTRPRRWTGLAPVQSSRFRLPGGLGAVSELTRPVCLSDKLRMTLGGEVNHCLDNLYRSPTPRRKRF